MNKLKCFRCSHPFHYWKREYIQNKETNHYEEKKVLIKQQIYFNGKGRPYCKDCLEEEIDWYWMDGDQVERILEIELPHFQYSYQKYMKSLFKIKCPQCDTMMHFFKEDMWTGEGPCSECNCWMIVDNGKLIKWYKNEEESYKGETDVKE